MIFIAYFTKNTPYESVINTHLLSSLKKWNLKYDIKAIKDLGSWNLNTRFKGDYILESLRKFKEDVCILDADAEIWQYPKLLFEVPDNYQIGCHRLHWNRFWHNNEGDGHLELLSGTMVVKYNEKAIELFEKYVKECDRDKGKKEQKILQNLVERDNYKVFDLPASYCAIKKFDGSIPEYIGEPVIVHYQASRQYRNFKRS